MKQRSDIKFDSVSALIQGARDYQEDALVADFPMGSEIGIIVLSDGMRLRCRGGQSVVLTFEATPCLVVVLPDMCYVLRAFEDGRDDVIAVPTPPDALRVPVLSAHYEDDACFVVTSNDGRQWPACKASLVVDLARVASSLNDVP